MPGDRLLGTLLRSLQTYADQEDTPRLLGSTSSLLTTLNNPLNVTLLTSQILCAPAIWTRPEGLRTSMRCLSVFHSAAQALIRHENALKEKLINEESSEPQLERTLPKDDWIKAVINGADDRAPRWRHLLVLGGLLLGFGSLEEECLSRSTRSTLESALVTAANLSIEEPAENDELSEESITLVLNHCFPLLADHERAGLDYDLLLPIFMRAMLHSSEGLQSAYFLGGIDLDIKPLSDGKFEWPTRSSSFRRIQSMLSSPLLASLGPLSRLIGHSVEQVRDPWLVTAAVEDLELFAKTFHLQWRQNKLSEIDASEENVYLGAQTLNDSTPQLWKLLKSTSFAVVIILRSGVGRVLNDRALANAEGRVRRNFTMSRLLTARAAAHILAMQALRTLRSLYFVAARPGSSTFSQYTFVYLTAMDIVSSSPPEVEAFIHSVRPSDHTAIPQHPLDRNLDLFFLNTAEHFTTVLPSKVAEEVLIQAASPYIAAGGNNNLLAIFEAAHSLMLAVFSAPQNAELTARHLPFYIEALFNVFPQNLTARQFRLAFKTLLRLTSPPSLLGETQPMLSATLLELLYEREKQASTTPMFPHLSEETAENNETPRLSEQAVLTLTVIDTLVHLPLDLLDEWLPLTADMVNNIEDDAMRDYCKEHFWHILVGGEMDPNRSGLCHAWWSTQGGRELLLFGREADIDEAASMSGAILDEPRENKL